MLLLHTSTFGTQSSHSLQENLFTDRQTDRQTDRRTDRRTHTHTDRLQLTLPVHERGLIRKVQHTISIGLTEQRVAMPNIYECTHAYIGRYFLHVRQNLYCWQSNTYMMMVIQVVCTPL